MATEGFKRKLTAIQVAMPKDTADRKRLISALRRADVIRKYFDPTYRISI